MNIILLSGGSGKRLWPLSNDTRSKQFLKLLTNEHGEYESMVQRVYGQIEKAGIQANIVVATGASQIDSIRRQLGNSVDIVIEPSRRDTFPAIALACSYLYSEKGIKKEEPVIVLPVDPFVELHYFYTLMKMEQAVKDGQADMILMGIEPTEPSSRYGYIIPEKKAVDTPVHVVQFKEKPEEELAKQLIAQGAVWNGGVFAFQLGYVLSILEKNANITNYQDLQKNYEILEKTSFDYAVAEKADSVAMILYKGSWKDLGTWNTLTEEMKDSCVGSVIMGEDCENTHIVNELSIPVVALGTKDLVIAASPDGILVSDKEKSSSLKPYVEKMNLRPMFEERFWGEYKVLDYTQYGDDIKSLTKHLIIQKGKNISYQIHHNRDEIWTIVDGTGELLIDDHIRNVRRGDVAYIVKGQKHAIRAVTDLHLIEVQIGNELTEEDIIRFDWNWD